jgi:hypothetical protein
MWILCFNLITLDPKSINGYVIFLNFILNFIHLFEIGEIMDNFFILCSGVNEYLIIE